MLLYHVVYVALKYISCWLGTAHVQCSGVMVSKTGIEGKESIHYDGFGNHSYTNLICEAESV